MLVKINHFYLKLNKGLTFYRYLHQTKNRLYPRRICDSHSNADFCFLPKNVTFQIVTSLHMFEVFFLSLSSTKKFQSETEKCQR